jgi:hypothetical protein
MISTYAEDDDAEDDEHIEEYEYEVYRATPNGGFARVDRYACRTLLSHGRYADHEPGRRVQQAKEPSMAKSSSGLTKPLEERQKNPCGDERVDTAMAAPERDGENRAGRENASEHSVFLPEHSVLLPELFDEAPQSESSPTWRNYLMQIISAALIVCFLVLGGLATVNSIGLIERAILGGIREIALNIITKPLLMLSIFHGVGNDAFVL